jgi:hypothetical protein
MLNLLSAQTCGFGFVQELQVFDAIRQHVAREAEIDELYRLSEVFDSGVVTCTGESQDTKPARPKRWHRWLI